MLVALGCPADAETLSDCSHYGGGYIKYCQHSDDVILSCTNGKLHHMVTQ